MSDDQIRKLAREVAMAVIDEQANAAAELEPKNLTGLLELIASHNPYTSGTTDDMDVHLLPVPPTAPSTANISRIEWEQDAGYPGDWSFKGQTQKINKVLKVKYRAAVHVKDQYGHPTNEIAYWMTAYLLIGFEDGTG